MAIQHSVAIRNAMNEAIEATIGTSAKLRIYSGSPPTNCASSPTGTLLVEFSLASDWSTASSGGSKALATVTGTAGIANGNAGHYRLCDSSGNCHEQGTVSQPGGGGDAIIDNVAIAIGQIVNVLSWVWTQPGG